MTGVRLWELMVAATWLFGLWLCLRHTRRSFLLGVYLSTTLTFGYDWLFARDWMWRMTFHPESLWLFELFGEKYALWAPLSYGFFFGIAAYLGVRHRDWLDRVLGIWQYLLAFPVIFLLNIVVEGTAIELWQVNCYRLPPQWLIANIPWLHMLTTGTMFSGTLFLVRHGHRLLETLGWNDFIDEGPAPNAELTRIRSSVFFLGLAIPQAAFYAALVLGLFLYDLLAIAPGPASCIRP